MYPLRLTDQARQCTALRETDIRDYYLPSPLAHAGGLQIASTRTPAVPLPTHRLMRRGRD
jgi:hypothetical protein